MVGLDAFCEAVARELPALKLGAEIAIADFSDPDPGLFHHVANAPAARWAVSLDRDGELRAWARAARAEHEHRKE